MALQQRQAQNSLTVADAAKLFGKSASWVRDRIATGCLHTLYPYGQRPYRVTEASAAILKAKLEDRTTGVEKPRLQAITGACEKTRNALGPQRFPHLVVNNTKP